MSASKAIRASRRSRGKSLQSITEQCEDSTESSNDENDFILENALRAFSGTMKEPTGAGGALEISDGDDDGDYNNTSLFSGGKNTSLCVNLSSSSRSSCRSSSIRGSRADKKIANKFVVDEEDAQGSYRNNLFSDSPYYDAKVDDEVMNLEILGNAFKDILSKVSAFTNAEKESATAARRLSMSCRLNINLGEAVSANGEESQDKSKILGRKVAQTLESFAEVMEDIAIAQESMCKTIESTFCEQLIQDTENELQSSKRLQEVARDETARTARLYSKYLNETRAEIQFEDGQGEIDSFHVGKCDQLPNDQNDKSLPGVLVTSYSMQKLDIEPKAESKWGNLRNIFTLSRKHQEIEERDIVIDWCSVRKRSEHLKNTNEDRTASNLWNRSMSDLTDIGSLTESICTEDDNDEEGCFDDHTRSITTKHSNGSNRTAYIADTKCYMKNIEIAEIKNDLDRIRLQETYAELMRFTFLKHFVDAKCQREFKFTLGMSQIAREMKEYFCNVTNSVERMITLVDKNENKCAELCGKNDVDKVGWKETEHALLVAVDALEDVALKSDKAIERLKRKDNCNRNNYVDLGLIEKGSDIWELPKILDKYTGNCRRKVAPDILVEGWMCEKMESLMSESWCKRWYLISNGALYHYELYDEQLELSIDHSHHSHHSVYKIKVCDLILSSIKELPNEPFCFQLTINNVKTLIFKTRGPYNLKMWTDGIQTAIEKEITNGNACSTELNKNLGSEFRRKSTEMTTSLRLNIYSMNGMEDSEHSDSNREDDNIFGDTALDPLVKEILKSNVYCADCNRSSPDWVSLNLGVLICIECSGIHRSLGVHISKVRSLFLDSLTRNETNLIQELGNDRVNPIWEKYATEKILSEKPTQVSDRKTRTKWITRKYVNKEFVSMKTASDQNDNVADNASCSLYKAIQAGDLMGVAVALAQGGDINWKNNQENGKTALQTCLVTARQKKKGSSTHQCVELLMQNNADTSILNKQQLMFLQHLRFSSSKLDLSHRL